MKFYVINKPRGSYSVIAESLKEAVKVVDSDTFMIVAAESVADGEDYQAIQINPNKVLVNFKTGHRFVEAESLKSAFKDETNSTEPETSTLDETVESAITGRINKGSNYNMTSDNYSVEMSGDTMNISIANPDNGISQNVGKFLVATIRQIIAGNEPLGTNKHVVDFVYDGNTTTMTDSGMNGSNPIVVDQFAQALGLTPETTQSELIGKTVKLVIDSEKTITINFNN